MKSTPLAITGWGTVSSLGCTRAEFGRSLQQGRSGIADVSGHIESPMPTQKACYAPDLDAKSRLGRKGLSFMDRGTILALLAAGEALQEDLSEQDRVRTGVVLGTTAGSTEATSNYSRATFVEDRPYLVNPLLFPNAVMNCAAGQTAIRYSLKGTNATIAGGGTALFSGLRYARNLLVLNKVDRSLVGCAEELSAQSAWEHHFLSAATGAQTAPGEAAAVFQIETLEQAERANRPVLAEVLGVQVRTHVPEDAPDTHDPGDRTPAFTTAIREALRQSGVEASGVDLWASGQDGSGIAAQESAAARAIWGDGVPELRLKEISGDCRSASAALQVGAVLELWAESTHESPRTAVVTGWSVEGSVGAAVLREPVATEARHG